MTDAPDCLSLGGLSDTAKGAIREFARLLALRFSGRIEIEVLQGGVRVFRETTEKRADDLKGS